MKKSFFAALAISAACLPYAALAQDVTVIGSGSVSTGDYGSDRDTTMGVLTGGVRVQSGNTSLQVVMPYVFTETPGVIFAGFDGTPLVMDPDIGGPKRQWEGFGDPTVSLSHVVRAGEYNFRGTGRVKIPVQNFNEVSTGETDFSVSGEVSRTVGNVTPFVAAGYRWYGNPEGWDIKDGFSASAGLTAPVGKGALAVSYEFAETTSDFINDSHEIVGVYDTSLGSSGVRLAAFGTVGLSSGAPDFGGGLRIAKSF